MRKTFLFQLDKGKLVLRKEKQFISRILGLANLHRLQRQQWEPRVSTVLGQEEEKAQNQKSRSKWLLVLLLTNMFKMSLLWISIYSHT